MEKIKIQQYYPLYPGKDNDMQSSENFYYNYPYDTYTPSNLLTTKSLYQDIVNQLQQLTYNYNNSPNFIQQCYSTTKWNTFINNSTSSSSASTTRSILLTTIPSPSYHDYTFNTNHNPNKNTTTTNITLLQTLSTPTTTTPSPTSQNVANIWGTSLTPTTLKSWPTTSKQPPKYTSDSSQDDNSFLCTK